MYCLLWMKPKRINHGKRWAKNKVLKVCALRTSQDMKAPFSCQCPQPSLHTTTGYGEVPNGRSSVGWPPAVSEEMVVLEPRACGKLRST